MEIIFNLNKRLSNGNQTVILVMLLIVSQMHNESKWVRNDERNKHIVVWKCSK